MKRALATCYLTLAPTMDGYGIVDGVKVVAMTQTPPKDPKGQIVAVEIGVDLAIFEPMALSLKGTLSRAEPDLSLEVDENTPYGQALAAAQKRQAAAAVKP